MSQGLYYTGIGLMLFSWVVVLATIGWTVVRMHQDDVVPDVYETLLAALGLASFGFFLGGVGWWLGQ